jgi:crossover junction endodeoxyribonuclease RuvC
LKKGIAILMNNFYCGIDPSMSATAIVVLDENDKIVLKKIIKSKPCGGEYDDVKRLIHTRDGLDALKEFNTEENKIKVCIEGISFGSKGRGADLLASLNYVVQMWLYENNIEYKCIPPNTLKKFVTGSGNSPKNIMLKEIYKRWGEDFDSDDIGDAYGLAKMVSISNGSTSKKVVKRKKK